MPIDPDKLVIRLDIQSKHIILQTAYSIMLVGRGAHVNISYFHFLDPPEVCLISKSDKMCNIFTNFIDLTRIPRMPF